MATAEKILLGYGTVTVGGTTIGLTRGGSSFMVEREFRQIEADGDKGPVQGRVVLDSQVAKLTVNALELFTAADMVKYYPALANATGTITSTFAIATGDYNDIVWTGATKDGKACTITITDALNLGNIEWTFEDKSEVVPTLEFTACYAEDSDVVPFTVVLAA